MTARRALWICALTLMAGGCPGEVKKPAVPDKGAAKKPPVVAKPKKPVKLHPDEKGKPGEKKVQPPLEAAQAPEPMKREAGDKTRAALLAGKIDSYFIGNSSKRIYIQVDKPLYKPGETIWIRSWDLGSRDLEANLDAPGIHYQLVSPKGSVVLRKRVRQEQGVAHNDFVIPEGVQGGEYKLRAISFDGQKEERAIIVSTYEPPRVKKKLEFLRKAYGVGDQVSATIEVKRPTGEPIKEHPLTAVIRVDNKDLPRVKVTTNELGGAVIKFTLPGKMELGDGLLTVLVEESGVTESVSKRIPIVLKKVKLSFFPEGGQLVSGLSSRVYFEAKNMIGKPADIEGRVEDDHGVAVAKFRSYHHGMGRFEFTPATGRSYKAVVTRPAGVKERFSLPIAMDQGCVLNSYDDFDGQEPALRVSVRCDAAQTVTVVAVMRENLIDAATVQVPEGEPAVIYLKSKEEALNRAQGTARITVFGDGDNPLAERLVYRNRRSLLKVKVEPHKKAYTPREQVTLKITTTGPDDKPVPAELALSVVDDTVISFADDKTGHMLSRLYLEQEIPGKVEEPKIFFDLTEKKAARGLDMLMGTRGWRKFEWHKVLNPPPPRPSVATGKGLRGKGGGGILGVIRKALGRDRGEVNDLMENAAGAEQVALLKVGKARGPAGAKAAPRLGGAPPAPPQEIGGMRAKAKKKPARRRPPGKPMPVMAAPEPPMQDPADQPAPAKQKIAAAPVVAADRLARQDEALANEKDRDWDNAKKEAKADEEMAMPEAKRMAPAPTWAVVRVFPAPTYTATHEGPRTDFRETVHWAPRVTTGKDGQAMVSFYLSDAVTSFRVFSEGAAQGLLGRNEQVFKSSLPFSMSIKLPLEVSAGDKLKLPLTLTNETNKPLEVKVTADFGKLLTAEKSAAERQHAELRALGSAELKTRLAKCFSDHQQALMHERWREAETLADTTKRLTAAFREAGEQEAQAGSVFNPDS